MRLAPDWVEVRRLHSSFENDVAWRFAVHVGCAGRESGSCVGHGRYFVDGDVDLVDDILGLFFSLCHHGGDGFADEANRAIRQHRLTYGLVVEFVQHRGDPFHTLEICSRDDRRTTRTCDATELPGGDRAAHEAHPMSGRFVRSETALSRNQCRVLQSADGATDPGHARASGPVLAHGTLFSRARRTTARTRSRLYSAVVW